MKIPPQPVEPKEEEKASSMLHFIQFEGVGFPMISLIIGALTRRVGIFRVWRNGKSNQLCLYVILDIEADK